MGFRPIEPGLRVMVNPSHDVLKVSLSVPAGDEVSVSDAVGAQLERQGFKDAAPAAVPAPVVADEPADEDAPKVKGKKG